MQEQINQLKTEVEQLKQQISNQDMPFEIREIVRNEVVKEEDRRTATELTVTVGVDGGTFKMPVYPNAYLVIKSRGKEYRIPYIDPNNIIAVH